MWINLRLLRLSGVTLRSHLGVSQIFGIRAQSSLDNTQGNAAGEFVKRGDGVLVPLAYSESFGVGDLDFNLALDLVIERVK